MSRSTSASSTSFFSRNGRVLIASGIVLFVIAILVARVFGVFDFESASQSVGALLEEISSSPLGPIALVAIFCVGAFIAVPQFMLIGVSVVAFGAVWGTVWAWAATLASGAMTYWIGYLSGGTLLRRFTGDRVAKFTQFVSRNAFAASAVVRNVPTGPFLVVNMVFGAIRAPFTAYWFGMAIGVVPKLLLVAFGLQAIQAALSGQLGLALGAALAAIAVFVGGWFYVRHKRRTGEILSLVPDDKVDTAQTEAQ